MAAAFFDTNILIYCFARGDARMARAQSLIDAGGAISVQCLNEFSSVALRKLQMPWPEIHEALQMICSVCHPVVPLDHDLHRIGIRLAEEFQLSIYDSMIAAAALASKCDTLYSEDMHHGLVIDGILTLVNPFKPV